MRSWNDSPHTFAGVRSRAPGVLQRCTKEGGTRRNPLAFPYNEEDCPCGTRRRASRRAGRPARTNDDPAARPDSMRASCGTSRRSSEIGRRGAGSRPRRMRHRGNSHTADPGPLGFRECRPSSHTRLELEQPRASTRATAREDDAPWWTCCARMQRARACSAKSIARTMGCRVDPEGMTEPALRDEFSHLPIAPDGSCERDE